ncbi:MAG: TIGR03790 family protein [Planctomycetota bacterium]
MSRMHVSAVLAFVIGSALALDARAAVTPDQVLVVVNDASAISVAVGSYYARVRGIPPGNVFHLPVGTPTTEAIYRSIYNTQIRNPLLAHLTVTRPDLRDRIRYLVLTKGVPHAIVNVSGRGLSQDCASVDSELTQLFTGRVPDDGQKGWVPNPYFDARVPFDTFSHPDLSYLVFRLDGYQSNVDPETGVPADIERLIDDSQRPAAFGRFVLDAKNPSGEGDDWIQAAADRLRARRIPVVHEPGRAAFAKNVDGILGYCSWGSNDPSNPGPPFFGEVPLGGGDVYPGTFLPGSVATCFVSTDARTLVNGRQWYSQSLIADLIHMGATAVNGHRVRALPRRRGAPRDPVPRLPRRLPGRRGALPEHPVPPHGRTSSCAIR